MHQTAEFVAYKMNVQLHFHDTYFISCKHSAVNSYCRPDTKTEQTLGHFKIYFCLLLSPHPSRLFQFMITLV